MGWEADCRATLPDGTERAARILLESEELIVPGRPRLRLARTELRSIKRSGRSVRIALPGDTQLPLAFPAEVDAERFLARIAAAPRTRVEKLGAKAGGRCLLAGRFDPPLAKELHAATGTAPATKVPRATAAPDADGRFGLVIGRVDSPSDQAGLARLLDHLAADGALWVAWPKGPGSVRHEDVVAWCGGLGLSQTRSMALNEELTALRFVRRRGAATGSATKTTSVAKKRLGRSTAARAKRR